MTTRGRGTEKATGGAGSAHPVKPPELDRLESSGRLPVTGRVARCPAIARRG